VRRTHIHVPSIRNVDPSTSIATARENKRVGNTVHYRKLKITVGRRCLYRLPLPGLPIAPAISNALIFIKKYSRFLSVMSLKDII
jgi:hypothetical protein